MTDINKKEHFILKESSKIEDEFGDDKEWNDANIAFNAAINRLVARFKFFNLPVRHQLAFEGLHVQAWIVAAIEQGLSKDDLIAHIGAAYDGLKFELTAKEILGRSKQLGS